MSERYTVDLDGVVVAVIVVPARAPRLRVKKTRPGMRNWWGWECGECHQMQNTVYGWQFAMGLAHAHLLQRHGAGRSVPVLRGESCG